MKTTGYSGKSLGEKLGIKPGFSVMLFNPPTEYFALLDDLPSDIHFAQDADDAVDLIHYFAEDHTSLNRDFPRLKRALKSTGALWVSWRKGQTFNENRIREAGLEQGLVDVKVIAVDATWSALKFVYRVKDRS